MPDDFALFKSECLRWIEFFGLTSWKIDFVHEKLRNEAFAECRVDGICDRYCVLALNAEISDHDRSYFDPAKTAFHEVLELLLWPLESCGRDRFVNPDDFVRERHALIRTLENTVYPKLKGENPCATK